MNVRRMLDPDALALLEQAAQRAGQPLSFVLNEAVRAGLREMQRAPNAAAGCLRQGCSDP